MVRKQDVICLMEALEVCMLKLTTYETSQDEGSYYCRALPPHQLAATQLSQQQVRTSRVEAAGKRTYMADTITVSDTSFEACMGSRPFLDGFYQLTLFYR